MPRHTAPGKSHRKGITLLELTRMFPDEQTATVWFERHVWSDGRGCGHCGSIETRPVPNAKPMPYWCTDCRSYFSVRTGTILERSHVSLRKWAFAMYLELTSLKSISSMKLHRDICNRPPGSCCIVFAKRGGARTDTPSPGQSKWTKPTSAAKSGTSTSGRSSTRGAGRSARPPSSARRIGDKPRERVSSSIPTRRRSKGSSNDRTRRDGLYR